MMILSVADFAAARAVTLASRFVVSSTLASPLASVFATVADKVPASDEKFTGILRSLLPLMSRTDAIRVTVPPPTGTCVGEAFNTTVSDAAAPTVIFTELLPAAVGVVPPVPPPVDGVPAPIEPEDAVTSATPETSPATNVVTA